MRAAIFPLLVPPGPACVLGGQRKKPTFFQHLTPTSSLPGQGETAAGGRRQNGVGAGSVLMEKEGTRPTTEGEGTG